MDLFVSHSPCCLIIWVDRFSINFDSVSPMDLFVVASHVGLIARVSGLDIQSDAESPVDLFVCCLTIWVCLCSINFDSVSPMDLFLVASHVVVIARALCSITSVLDFCYLP